MPPEKPEKMRLNTASCLGLVLNALGGLGLKSDQLLLGVVELLRPQLALLLQTSNSLLVLPPDLLTQKAKE